MLSGLLPFLDKIFRHPAVIALISVCVGTWLFGYFSYMRSVQDARRKKALTFLEDSSKPINAVMTKLFQCRTRFDPALEESLTGLFQQRLTVRIKSEAFLGSKSFSDEYDKIIRELEGIDRSLRA